MAKKKTIKLSIAAPSIEHPSSSESQEREEKYRMDEDARSVKSYLDLRRDPKRHSKAINYIRSQADDLDGLEGSSEKARKSPRGIARQGRRRAARNIGRA